MKKFEIIVGFLSLAGLILNLLMLPGGSILSIMSMGILSTFYFYFGFAVFNNIGGRKLFKKSSYEGISALKIIGGIGLGISLSIVVTGFLFKLMMWAGGSFMILMGSMPLVIAGIIAATKIQSSKSGFSARVLPRAAIFGGLGILCFLLPSNSILKVKYRCCPDYVNAVEASSQDPENKALQEKAQEELDKINEKAGK